MGLKRGLGLHEAREAHEREREESGGDEGERDTLEGAGRIRVGEPLADAGEEDEGEAEAEGGGKGEEDALAEGRAALVVQLRDAEDGAVRRDERQEDAERGVQGRHEALQREVDELHERGDHEDERERVDVAEPEGREQQVVEPPRHGRGEGHHEEDRAGHAKGGLDPLRDAKERATA